MKRKTWLSLLVVAFTSIPLFALAQSGGFVPCGDEGEPVCQMCYFASMIDSISTWLVAILAVIAAIIFIVAGLRLVTSTGNVSEKESAKKMIVNTFIGFVIVLAAWIVIDFMLQALVNPASLTGPWNSISCVAQPEAQSRVNIVQGGAIQQANCDPGPSGDLVICSAQEAACRSNGGIPTVNTSNPTRYTVDCALGGTPRIACTQLDPTTFDCSAQEAECTAAGGNPTRDMSGTPPREYVLCALPAIAGGGSCTQVNDPTNACDPSNLTCFGDANAASQICNLESGGGNTGIMSGSDRCADGNSFSGGLWQINVLANASRIPGCSGGFFTTAPSAPNACDTDGNSAQGGCLDCRTNSNGVQYCARWNCTITDYSAYSNCVAQTRDPAVNTAVACDLYSNGGWNHWRTSARTCGVI